jgi:hypothetical protein
MTELDDESLQAECRLRLIALCRENIGERAPTGVDLFVEGFWAAVDAMRDPQGTRMLDAAMKQAIADGLVLGD